MSVFFVKNNVKYILKDCEILCIPLWQEWFLDSIVVVVKGVEKQFYEKI